MYEPQRVDRAASPSAAQEARAASYALLLLDAQLRVRLMTPAAQSLSELSALRHGDPVAVLARQLHDPRLEAQAHGVLAGYSVPQEELETPEGHCYIRCLLLHRNHQRPAGVIVSISDISESWRRRRAALECERCLHSVIEAARDYSIFALDPTGRIASRPAGRQAAAPACAGKHPHGH